MAAIFLFFSLFVFCWCPFGLLSSPSHSLSEIVWIIVMVEMCFFGAIRIVKHADKVRTFHPLHVENNLFDSTVGRLPVEVWADRHGATLLPE